MQNQLIESLVISLALTLAFELALALLCRIRGWRELLLVVLVNFMTNPPVVLTHNLMKLETPLYLTLLLEALVVVLEGFCYKLGAPSLRRPFLFSLGANALSYTGGLIVLHFVNGG